jgi:hypothetical protein
MGKPAGLAEKQRSALDRLRTVPGMVRMRRRSRLSPGASPRVAGRKSSAFFSPRPPGSSRLEARLGVFFTVVWVCSLRLDIKVLRSDPRAGREGR